MRYDDDHASKGVCGACSEPQDRKEAFRGFILRVLRRTAHTHEDISSFLEVLAPSLPSIL